MRIRPARPVAAPALVLALAMAIAGCSGNAPPAPVPDPAAQAGGTDAAGPAAHADVHRFDIGGLQAFVLKDGDIEVANDGGTLAIGQPKSETDALLQSAQLATDPLRLSVQGLLVRSGDRLMLFDTGAGAAEFVENGGRLPQSLAAAGFAPADVTDILLSHGHGDHVGGLLDGDGRPVFANATVRLSSPEWRALQAGEDAALAAAIASRVETFMPGSEVLPGVKAVAVDGHTPGHSAYEIADGGVRLMYIGDSAHHHVISVQRPRWTIAFDGDAPTAEASREALLARLADDDVLVSSPHFPFPGVGRIERRDDGFAWAPVE